jgi:SOS-response transcriptional repressor LexA
MVIGERLRLLRKEKNMSKRELVATLPLNYSTYANYESGFREPNSEVLQILARYFGVSVDFLLGMTEKRKKADEIAALTGEEHDHIRLYRTLDVHGKELVECVIKKECERVNFPNERAAADHKQVNKGGRWVSLQVFQQQTSAGLGDYLADGGDDYEIARFMSTPVSLRADFCVRVKGDGMEPKIRDGDVVFVKAAPQIDPGAIGVFVYEGEAYCKRLRVDPKMNRILLESLNKAYAPKEINQPDRLRTVGLVIGVAEGLRA